MSAAEDRLLADVDRFVADLEQRTRPSAPDTAECVICGRIRRLARLVFLGDGVYRCAQEQSCDRFARPA